MKPYLTFTLKYLLIAVTCFASCWLYHTCFVQKNRVVYINHQQLFDEFLLKKELEKEYQALEKGKMKEIDSLQGLLTNIAEEIKIKYGKTENIDVKDPLLEHYKLMQEFILQKQEDTQLAAEKIAQGYDSKIWKQLNKFVMDYAKMEGYDYVLGSKGDGNIMYAQDRYDATNDMIRYANNRYIGKNE